jgi:serine/threonine-protein kinase
MDEALAVGESWSGYTVVEVLGSTTLAERYRVRAESGEVHVLDVLAIRHPALVERLRDAGLDRISHPNLLGVHDVVSVLRFPAVVSADSSGMPLSQWLKRSPARADRLEVFAGIAAAVAELHRHGVAHGLLHPDLVLIEQRRGRPFPRVALPGVAAVVYGILREGAAVSTSGASLGSPMYQSPEQMRSPERTTPASDAYTLGTLLYWLLAGRSPFAGMDPLACYEAARDESWPPLRSNASDVPAEIDQLVADMMRTDPEARPTAEAALDVTNRALGRGPGLLLPIAVGAGLGLVTLLALAAALLWLLGR